MSFSIKQWVRPNIFALKAYSSARDEYSGQALMYLDANENPYPSPVNRYPDPLQMELKSELAKRYKVRSTQTFLGNGSDEAIDLLIRASCTEGTDKILALTPSYGMYQVCADIQGVELVAFPLEPDFTLDVRKLKQELQKEYKLVFLCSPNNPTGNTFNPNELAEIFREFPGVVVVDEAYQEFANNDGFIPLLQTIPNLVVLRTFSKAWGMAGLRCGMAFGSEEVVEILNRIKYPYNLNVLTQREILNRLRQENIVLQQLAEIKEQRDLLIRELEQVAQVKHVYPSEANFVLIRVIDAQKMYQFLLNRGIVVRDRSKQFACENCLRISVGTPSENQKLIEEMKQWS